MSMVNPIIVRIFSRFLSQIYVTERPITQLYSTLHAAAMPIDLTDRS